MPSFFQKHIYGNKKSDFSSSSLQKTRKALFSYLFKTRILRLVSINIWSFLFILPLVTWLIISRTYEQSFGDLTMEANFEAFFKFVVTIKTPMMIFCYVVAFIGLAGTFYVLRMMVWNLPVFIGRGFFKGIRQSWRHFLAYGFAIGVYLSIFEIAYLMLYWQPMDAIIKIVVMGLLVLSLVLLLSISLIGLSMSSTYTMTLKTSVISSLKLTLRYLFKNILMILTALLPTTIWFIVGNIWLALIGTLVLFLIGISYASVVTLLFTNSLFDVHINLGQYPEYYRKGLAPLKEENHA